MNLKLTSTVFNDSGSRKLKSFLAAPRRKLIDVMRYLNSVDETLIQERDDDDDNTALTLASEYGSKDTVEYLLTELKVDIHETGFLEQQRYMMCNNQKFCRSVLFYKCIAHGRFQ